MADRGKRLPTNVPGPFFVDSTCIDCDTCRWMAPEVFGAAEDQARVWRQPGSAEARRRALRALIACPTSSIGNEGPDGAAEASRDFPLRIDSEVLHCGFHHEASFGATSYLLLRSGGNVMVDVPRWSQGLARRIEELGGVSLMFLTHRDDVAGHERWQERFGCRRILHAADAGRGLSDLELILDGKEPIALAEDLLAIPVPGHTRGSMCLLHDGRHLFTGDHLAYSPRRGHLYAFRDACWYSWDELVRSMERLARHRFEWVLPGHGRRIRFVPERMEREMARCLAWVRAQSGRGG